MKKTVLRLLRISVLSYVGLIGVLYFTQESLLFLPETTPANFEYRYNATEVFLPVTNAMLHGLSFEAETPKGLILYFHGNAGSLKDWGSVCENFVALNFNCLIFDFRGYGKSTGQIQNEAQWFADGEAMLKYAQNNQNLPITLYGRSVGSSMASYLAGKHTVDKVILETAPYSFTAVAQKLYPYAPVKWLLKYRFENATYLANNQNPTLLIHGTNDEAIPYSQFEKLKARFPRYQTLLIAGGRHNDLGQYEAYWEGVRSFLSD